MQKAEESKEQQIQENKEEEPFYDEILNCIQSYLGEASNLLEEEPISYSSYYDTEEMITSLESQKDQLTKKQSRQILNDAIQSLFTEINSNFSMKSNATDKIKYGAPIYTIFECFIMGLFRA